MRDANQGENVARGLARLAAFPASLVGLGFFRSWITLLTNADFMVGLNGMAHDAILSGVLLVLALLAGQVTPLFRRHWAIVSCFVLALGSSILAILGNISQTEAGWAGVGVAALAACASALFILMWSDLYSRLDAANTALALALAMLVDEASNLLLAGMSETYRLGALVVLPCLCTVTLLLARSHIPMDELVGLRAEKDTSEQRTSPLAIIPWNLIALVGIYQFTSATCLGMSGASTGLFGSIANVLAAGVVISCVLFFSEKFNLATICKSPAVLLIPTLLLLPFAGGTHGAAAGAFASLSSSLFSLLVFLVICDISRVQGISAVLLFGVEEATTGLGALGALLGEQGPSLSAAGVSPTAVMAVLVALTVVAGLTLFDGESLTRRWGVRILGPGKMAVGARDRELLERACREAAAACGLTARELEVLLLLAQDKSATEICSELGVARGTFKAHCEHIYTKTDVRSKKELLRMLSSKA